MASGTRPSRPTTAGENSNSTAAPAADTATTMTKPTTWPAAMRWARSSGAPATMAIVTTQLSMLVPTNAAAATPMSAPRPAGKGGRQPAGSGIAGPKGLSPRRVTRCA